MRTDPKRYALAAGLLVAGALSSAPTGSAAPARWTSAGLDGGVVESLAIAPGRPELMLAGTREGVFKSVDAGAHWTAASIGLAHLDVREVAFDRDDPDVAYAATDGGLFKTITGGLLWTKLPNRLHRYVLEVELLYGDETTILTQNGGVLKASRDGGLTWETLYHHPRDRQIWDVVVSPTDSDTIYLAVALVESEDGVIERSDDGGRTWTRVLRGNRNSFPFSLDVDPRDTDVLNAVGSSSGLESRDGGRTWEPQSLDVSGQPSNLTRSPSDADVLYATGYHHPGPGMFVSRSDDGGATWEHVGDIAEMPYPTAPVVSPADGDTLYVGTFGAGDLVSTDGGRTFTRSSAGLTAAPAEDISFDPGNPLTAYATTMRGVFKSIDAGLTWTQLDPALEEPAQPLAAPFPNAVAVDEGGAVYVTRSIDDELAAPAIFRSDDGGSSWTKAADLPSPARVLLAHPDSAGVLLAGAEDGLYRSDDAGAAWRRVAPGEGRVEDLALDPATGAVYALTGGWTDPRRNNGLFRSDDFGGSWERLRHPPFSDATQLAVRGTPLMLYVGNRRATEVAVSLDGGASWTVHEVDYTNFSSNVSALAVDPLDPTQVLAGTTDGGVWLSVTSGTTWVPLTPGRYGQSVYDIAFMPLGVDLPDVPIADLQPALAGVSVPRRSGVWQIVPAPHAFRRPRPTGTPDPGETLTCERGRWSRARGFGFSWTRDGEAVRGATDETYRVRARDEGHEIACRVKAKGPGGRGSARSRGLTI